MGPRWRRVIGTAGSDRVICVAAATGVTLLCYCLNFNTSPASNRIAAAAAANSATLAGRPSLHAATRSWIPSLPTGVADQRQTTSGAAGNNSGSNREALGSAAANSKTNDSTAATFTSPRSATRPPPPQAPSDSLGPASSPGWWKCWNMVTLGGAALDGDLVHDDIVAIVRNPDVVGAEDYAASASPMVSHVEHSGTTGETTGDLSRVSNAGATSGQNRLAPGSGGWFSPAMWANDFWGTPMASSDSHKSYRPLTVLTFRLNYLYGGLSSTRSYHVVNVLLHLICCLLLGELMGRLNDARTQSGRPRSTLALQVITILVFGVQPVHTEAVTSIVGRADLLCGAFYLLALLVFVDSCADDERSFRLSRDEVFGGQRCQEPDDLDEVRSLSSSGEAILPPYSILASISPVSNTSTVRARTQQRTKVKVWLSMSLVVLSLLSKEQGLTVLGVFILYRLRILLARQRRCLNKCDFGGVSGVAGFSGPFHRLMYLFTTDEHLVASSVTLAGLVAFRIALLGGTLPRFSEHDNPASHHPHLLTRTLTYGYLAAMNAGVLLWPRVLSYDWQMGSVPLVHSLFDVRNLSTVTLVVVLLRLLRRAVHENFRLLFLCASGGVSMLSAASKTADQADVHHTQHNNNNNSSSYRGGPVEKLRHSEDDRDNESADNREGPDGGPLLLTSAALAILPWLPASNLLVTVGFVLAERILYIPSMGFCLLFVEGLRRLLLHFQDPTIVTPASASPVHQHHSVIYQQGGGGGCRNTWNRRQKIVLAALFLLLVMGAIRTVRRNRVWMTRETLFESGVREMPTNCKMHYNYANLQRDLGRSAHAERHYKIALELCPTHASAHNNLGTVLASPSPAEAEKHFRKAININLHHAGAHYNLAMLYRRRGQVEVARGLLERSLALDASLAEAASSLAELEGQRGRTNEAEKLHRRAIELNGRSAPIRNNYATFLHHQGRLREASRQYLEAVAIEPTNTVAMVNAAETMKKLQVDQEAEDLYRRALSLNAEDVSVMDQLAVLYVKAERFREAEELFAQILEKYPQHRDSRLHYSQMLLSQGDASTSERILLEALKQSRSSPWRDGLRQMALLYSYTNRSADAAEWIRKAIQLCPADGGRECAPLYADYGDILKDLSHLNRSAECYMEAIKIQPDLAHAHINLGVIRHLQGDYPAAFDHYTVAYTLEPWNTLVVENMDKLRRRILKSFRQHRTTIDAAFEVS